MAKQPNPLKRVQHRFGRAAGRGSQTAPAYTPTTAPLPLAAIVWLGFLLLACSTRGDGIAGGGATALPEECRAYTRTLARCFDPATGTRALSALEASLDGNAHTDVEALRARCATQDDRARLLCR